MVISEEEKKYRAGQGMVERQLYARESIGEIDRELLLKRGRLITVRPHSRFVDFPEHRHNYVEIMYVVQGKMCIRDSPMTVEGLKAVKVLSAEGIKTNVTLIFTANQALLAARAGATYVSPFLGRLDDISTAGIDLIQDIVQIFDNYGLETEIIAASIRNPIHVTDCALAGAHIATVPYKVIEQMTKHPLTDAGIEKFQADYRAVFGD